MQICDKGNIEVGLGTAVLKGKWENDEKWGCSYEGHALVVEEFEWGRSKMSVPEEGPNQSCQQRDQ